MNVYKAETREANGHYYIELSGEGGSRATIEISKEDYEKFQLDIFYAGEFANMPVIPMGYVAPDIEVTVELDLEAK